MAKKKNVEEHVDNVVSIEDKKNDTVETAVEEQPTLVEEPVEKVEDVEEVKPSEGEAPAKEGEAPPFDMSQLGGLGGGLGGLLSGLAKQGGDGTAAAIKAQALVIEQVSKNMDIVKSLVDKNTIEINALKNYRVQDKKDNKYYAIAAIVIAVAAVIIAFIVK